MPVHAVLLHALALVLCIAGVRKVLDPAPITTSMRRSGLPSSPALGRVLGVVEVVASLAVLVVGGAAAAAGLGVIYLGFLGFIASNRLRGMDVPCGCFGESTEPPGAAHLVVNAAGAAVAIAAVVAPVDGVAGWLDDGIEGAAGLALVAVAAALVVALLEVLPQTRSAARHDHDSVPTFSLKDRR